MVRIVGACDTKCGNYRDTNEDNYLFNYEYAKELHTNLEKILAVDMSNKNNNTFAIFDGVGGEAKGEKASYLAAKSIIKYKSEHKVLDEAEYIQYANEVITAKSSKMATTACLITFDKTIKTCNLGDSRIYLLRDNKLKQISVDDTDQALNKKLNIEGKKPQLMQYLGIDENELVLEPHIKEFDYQIGDKFLLCTDGLTDALKDNKIEEILNQDKSPKELVSELMEEALKSTKDNTTIMVFEIKNDSKKNNYLPLIIIPIVFIILIIIIFKVFFFQIEDNCDSLSVGNSCTFKFNDKKYNVEIEDENIITYEDGKLIGNSSGKTSITITKNNKTVYEKEIKVFPKK